MRTKSNRHPAVLAAALDSVAIFTFVGPLDPPAGSIAPAYRRLRPSVERRRARSPFARWLKLAALGAVLWPAAAATAQQNLIQNPGFEQGAVGFASAYVYAPGHEQGAPGRYTVTDNINDWNSLLPGCADHSAPGTRLLVVDGKANIIAWQQTVAVQPHTGYRFRFWYLALDPQGRNPPQLVVTINNGFVGSVQLLPDADCVWHSYELIWESGDAGQATISINDSRGELPGNDFAIDDLELTDCFPPIITSNPAPHVIFPGWTARFTVAASSAHPPLTYVWRRNGVPLTNGPTPSGSIVSGANSAALTISRATRDDGGLYDCEITSAGNCGTSTSNPAMLSVVVIRP